MTRFILIVYLSGLCILMADLNDDVNVNILQYRLTPLLQFLNHMNFTYNQLDILADSLNA